MIGRRIRHYEIEEEIGRGGMGVVYRAVDTALGREIAIKMLPPTLAGDGERIRLLQSEARTIASLKHPRIITIYSIEREGDLDFLTMELVEGRPLDKVIPRSGFGVGRLFELAVPLADALSAAHEAGVVHRDLKPGNIMVSNDGRPSILDFGLAQLKPGTGGRLASRLSTETLPTPGKVAGTVPYMSPEQLRGEAVDHRSDIFSLGIILFEMATGRHPFQATKASDPIQSILEVEPAPLTDSKAGLPRQLARIVRHCLEKDPELRMQSAKDLRNELADLKRELTQPAVPTHGPPSVPPRVRRLRLVAGVLAGTVAVTGLAGWLVLRPRPTTVAPTAVHLAVVEKHLIPGPQASGIALQGMTATLRDRLTRGLEGAYLVRVGDGPEPDVELEIDFKQTPSEVMTSFRLRGRGGEDFGGVQVFEGRLEDAVGLLDRVARTVASTTRAELGLPVRYRAPPQLTANAAALASYFDARGLRETAAASDDESARELLAAALQIDPGLTAAQLELGRLHLARFHADSNPGELDEAWRRCEKAALAEPGFFAAHTCLGDVLRASDRPLDAVAAYLRAIELNGADTAAFNGLRLAYDDLGRPTEAEATWRHVIDLHPDLWTGHFQLGGFFTDREEYTAAIESYERSLALAPRNYVTYFALGSAQLLLGRYGEAVESLEASIRIRPNHRALTNLGYTYTVLRRYPEALQALERAVEFEDATFTDWGNLAQVYYALPGHDAETREAARRAADLCVETLRADPSSPGARLMLAVNLALLGDRDEALEALAGALSQRPEDSHYFYLAAVVHNLVGNREEALDWLEKAVGGGYSTADIRGSPALADLTTEPRFRALFEAGGRSGGS